MQITKSAKKQQQQQPQQQQQQSDQNRANRMFKVSMFKVDKSKLILLLAACLVAALIACGSSKSEIEETKSELDAKLKSVQGEQISVRKYVQGLLKEYESGSGGAGPQMPRSGAHLEAGQQDEFQRRRLADHQFAKMVLNAYDRPYGHVIDAINKLRAKLNTVGQQETASTNKVVNGSGLTQQQESAQQLLMEAYGRVLEDSQKHSVLIQEEIRRHQERVPNEEGKQSQRMKQLAQFETNLIGGYLKEALAGTKDT